MRLRIRIKFLLIIFSLVCLAIRSASSNTLSSNAPSDSCDIHSALTKAGKVPNYVPIPTATTAWLPAFGDDFHKSYQSAKKECEAALVSDRLKTSHPPFYADVKSAPLAGQHLCRGPSLLFDLTGMLVWPFGPTKTCSTYSACWFGLITCGQPKLTNIQNVTFSKIDEICRTMNITVTLADIFSWSIKSLAMHARVVGPELVVPEQRLYSLSKEQDEVIILKYHLTMPGNYRLEVRHLEFYPSALLPWSSEHLRSYGLQSAGRVFLGGAEARCRPWSKCSLSYNCCGCDAKSFLLSGPIEMEATDGSNKCPSKQPSLPRCPALSSAYPGRWIQSSHQSLASKCSSNSSYNMMVEVVKAVEKGRGWGNLASGNPCIHVSDHVHEDANTSNWFFAPYSCKYHFYTSEEVKKCFESKTIRHVHFQGDYLSRDLFAVISKFLGIPLVESAELKRVSNILKEQDLYFHSGSLLLSEGFSWEWNPHVMRLIEKPPIPDVLVVNHAITHRSNYPYLFNQTLFSTEYKYWTEERNASVPLPRYRIFQNVRDLHGLKHSWFIGNSFRMDNDILSKMYRGLGFYELDEYSLTRGRFDTAEHSDGWHFEGSTRQMEAVVLFNMLCNDWLETQNT